jgi:hypothetical protein
MSRIQVNIDRLVLKGFDPGDGRALAAALQKELRAALADPANRAEWARSHRTPVLRLGPIPWEPGAAAAGKLGGGIARAIGRGLKP